MSSPRKSSLWWKYVVLMVGCHFAWPKLTVLRFQDVLEKYEKAGWTKHHDQPLEFEKPEDGSKESITLSFEEVSRNDKWEITSINPNQVRNFSPCMHIITVTVLTSCSSTACMVAYRSLNERWIACQAGLIILAACYFLTAWWQSNGKENWDAGFRSCLVKWSWRGLSVQHISKLSCLAEVVCTVLFSNILIYH